MAGLYWLVDCLRADSHQLGTATLNALERYINHGWSCIINGAQRSCLFTPAMDNLGNRHVVAGDLMGIDDDLHGSSL